MRVTNQITFTAKDDAEALRLAAERLGRDAVILSTQMIKEGAPVFNLKSAFHISSKTDSRRLAISALSWKTESYLLVVAALMFLVFAIGVDTSLLLNIRFCSKAIPK